MSSDMARSKLVTKVCVIIICAIFYECGSAVNQIVSGLRVVTKKSIDFGIYGEASFNGF